MNIEKLLSNTNLHHDIILLIEKEYYKIIKNDCLNELNCLIHKYHKYNDNTIHMIVNGFKTTIYYPTYIKSFYRSSIIGRWSERTQYYYNLKKIKTHYIDHTKLFSYSLQ
jgi:hypothetical protein